MTFQVFHDPYKPLTLLQPLCIYWVHPWFNNSTSDPKIFKLPKAVAPVAMAVTYVDFISWIRSSSCPLSLVADLCSCLSFLTLDCIRLREQLSAVVIWYEAILDGDI